MAAIAPFQLRARFAHALSDMYAREVPAYGTLLEVAGEINEAAGASPRVTAERHGAIRLGSPRELAQAARLFAAMGMHPVGFYDLRDASEASLPVIATAFRPVDSEELERNPFRVFTSLLATPDRRFFSPELAERIEAFVAGRELFAPELLALADRAVAEGSLDADRADRFLTLATRTFELSREPVEEDWYRELERISAVAADIAGVRSTHINHLTPRVLDIDALYDRMTERGVTMIDTIQGPPRWDGPDVLLRQTSFRALAEPRRFRRRDGSVHDAELRVRFGEVEARGIALTEAGRELYDALPPDARIWNERFPRSERELAERDLAFFTYHARPGRPPAADVATLLETGWLTLRGIVYEDFLPRSAAGIFRSNLSEAGTRDAGEDRGALDAAWLEGVLDRELLDPYALYRSQSEASLTALDLPAGVA